MRCGGNCAAICGDVSKHRGHIAGPMAAMMCDGCAPSVVMALTVWVVMSAMAPLHPAWMAAMVWVCGSWSMMGTQSAVWMRSGVRWRLVTSASVSVSGGMLSGSVIVGTTVRDSR